MSTFRPGFDSAYFNGITPGFLPGLLGIRFLEVAQGRARAELCARSCSRPTASCMPAPW
jgi:hypothetical protein